MATQQLTATENQVSTEKRKVFTKEEVERANMPDAVEMCQRHGLQYGHAVNLDDIKTVLMAYLQRKEECEDASMEEERDENIQKMIMNITGKDIEMKNFLCDIYESILELIEMSEFDASLKEEFTTKYDDYRGLIDGNRAELGKTDCPIVVTGETSAGKSSLLNLFLGTEILPSSLLRCTSVICRLRNSGEQKVIVYDEKEIPTEIKVANINDLKQKIKAFTCFNDESDTNGYRYVDIYWSIPMLHKHVIIVDTPGIGDSHELTERVMEYLQDSVAFIYVINSANAGGVQSDRLLRIIKTQQEWKRQGKLQMFDPRLALFVCNKWDQVPKDEEKIVWQNTIFKLSQSWVGLDDTQVMKLSVMEETRRQDHGLPFTEKFKCLFKAIKTMVPLSLEGKVKRHAIWLLDFLSLVQLSTATKTNASRKTKEEKKKYYKRLESRLDLLTNQTKEIKHTLVKYLDEKKERVVDALLGFLNRPDTQQKLSTWNMDDCPSVSTIGSGLSATLKDYMLVTKAKALQSITERIQNEVGAWLRENGELIDLADDFRREFKSKCQMLHDESNGIQREMSELDFPLINQNTFHIELSKIDFDKPKLEKPNEMIALGTGVGLGIMSAIFGVVFPPILIGSCVLGIVVLLGYTNRYQRQMSNCKEDYNEKRQDYMKQWTIELLKTLKKEDICNCLEDWYFQDVRNQVKVVCDDLVPKIINTDRKIMNHVISDQRRAESIFRMCQPLQQKAEECQGKVLLFQLKYLSENFIPQERIRQEEKLGEGVFAMVYKAKVFLDDKWVPAALKIFKHPLDESITYIQLLEMENLLKFDHANVLKLYGASLIERNGYQYLELVTELCEMTLNEKLHLTSCGRITPGTLQFTKALKFYIETSLQIVEGLEHIHSRECAHRDLKLQNILIKGQTFKIADAGQLKRKDLITGSLVGTPTYMAPEVLKGQYTTHTVAMDIYSLGIILWEMWYKRHAFSESQHPEFQNLIDITDCLEKGGRPPIEADMEAFPLIKGLIEACWNGEPNLRPTVQQVKQRLEIIQTEYCRSGFIHEGAHSQMLYSREEIV